MANNCKESVICGVENQELSIELLRNEVGNFSSTFEILPGMKDVTIRSFGNNQLEVQFTFQDGVYDCRNYTISFSAQQATVAAKTMLDKG